MDLLTLQEEVRSRVGEAAVDEDFFKTTRITRLLNRAQVRFCHEELWPWLISWQGNISVPNGTNVIELIDDVVLSRHWALVLAKASGDILLPKRINIGEIPRVRQQTRSSKGDPRWYAAVKTVRNTYGDNDEATAHTINLFPTPNATLTAEYYFIREPTAMAVNGDEPDMPDAYHDAVAAWATAKLFEQELRGAETKRQEQFEEYIHVLETARKDMKQMAVDDQVIVGGEDPRVDQEPFISYRNIPERLSP